MIGTPEIIEEAAANIIGRCHNDSDLGNDSPRCKPDMQFAGTIMHRHMARPFAERPDRLGGHGFFQQKQ
jgi:hypothetical protein